MFSLYVTCCFSFAAFNIVFLCLVFVRLVCVLLCFSLGLSYLGLFVHLGLDYFLFHVGEIFDYNLLFSWVLELSCLVCAPAPFLIPLLDVYLKKTLILNDKCNLHSMILTIPESESEVAQSCSTLCNPMDTRLFLPWDFLGKSTGVGYNT